MNTPPALMYVASLRDKNHHMAQSKKKKTHKLMRPCVCVCVCVFKGQQQTYTHLSTDVLCCSQTLRSRRSNLTCTDRDQDTKV